MRRAFGGKTRRQPTGYNVHKYGFRRQSLDGRLQKLFGLDALNEEHIRSGVCRQLQSDKGLIHPQYLGRIGSADDHKVGVSGYRVARDYRSTYPHDEFLARHDLLAQ